MFLTLPVLWRSGNGVIAMLSAFLRSHFGLWLGPCGVRGCQGPGAWGGSMMWEGREPQQGYSARWGCLLTATISYLLAVPQDPPTSCGIAPSFLFRAVTVTRHLFNTYICWSSRCWPKPIGKATHDHQVNLDLVSPVRLKTYSCPFGFHFTG